MKQPVYKSGAEFWNEDKTQGYALVRDVYAYDPLFLTAWFRPLGSAPEPQAGALLPDWLFGAVCKWEDDVSLNKATA